MTNQAENNLRLCKGQPAATIKQLFQIGNLRPSILEELADHFNVPVTIDAVANALSKMR